MNLEDRVELDPRGEWKLQMTRENKLILRVCGWQWYR